MKQKIGITTPPDMHNKADTLTRTYKGNQQYNKVTIPRPGIEKQFVWKKRTCRMELFFKTKTVTRKTHGL